MLLGIVAIKTLLVTNTRLINELESRTEYEQSALRQRLQAQILDMEPRIADLESKLKCMSQIVVALGVSSRG
jgi:hypothetical protein